MGSFIVRKIYYGYFFICRNYITSYLQSFDGGSRARIKNAQLVKRKTCNNNNFSRVFVKQLEINKC